MRPPLFVLPADPTEPVEAVLRDCWTVPPRTESVAYVRATWDGPPGREFLLTAEIVSHPAAGEVVVRLVRHADGSLAASVVVADGLERESE